MPAWSKRERRYDFRYEAPHISQREFAKVVQSILIVADSMQITLDIPDELAASLALLGKDPARAALEAIGLEGYRHRRITGYQLRTLLGIASRYEFDGFLKEHEVEKYTAEDFEHDLANINETDSRARF